MRRGAAIAGIALAALLASGAVLDGAAPLASERAAQRDVMPTLRAPSALWLATAPVGAGSTRDFRGGWSVEAIPGSALSQGDARRGLVPVPRPNPRRGLFR